MSAKSVIVTGSTSGIGLAIASQFVQQGMNVMLNGFADESEINELQSTLRSQGSGLVEYSNADMTQPTQIINLVDQARSAFGGIDIVVNNAGIQHVSPVEEFDPAKWDAIMAINLSSAFHTTRLTMADMKQRGWGRIVNIASAHALVASPFKSAYVAAKHGLLGFTKTIALEGAQFGVTANAICPGYVLTPLVQQQIPDTAKARGMSEEQVKTDVLLSAQPTRQFVQTEQIAALASYLCSDAAASITGSALPIDGGWTAQ